MPHSSHVV
ncbi:hypothetical protein Taro_040380 [Colocasia esculenta]|uniref:Uncharacterized protein n=1 Tax=Colocasia esculenta TaxID=4460 RepID=A0A843WYA9_COLES|nr:hypothetical protein [Colocasia esculenta]